MAKPITSLPINSFVKDPSSLHDGLPIKWRIIDFNHKGYPTNTVTLIALIDKKVTVDPWFDRTKEGNFLTANLSYPERHISIGSILEGIYENLSKKFKSFIRETDLEIQYSGEYSGYIARSKRMLLKMFLIGASEYNHGSSTSVTGPYSQEHFAMMKDFNSQGLPTQIGVGPKTNYPILSRDIGISSGDYGVMYPTTIAYQYANYNNSAAQAYIHPITNLSVDSLMVSDEPDEDGVYILNMIDNKYLIQDGLDIKSVVSGQMSSVGTAPVTKAMFDSSGMKTLSEVTGSMIASLTSDNAEVLCWTDEATSSMQRTLNRTVLPFGQIVKSTEDLAVSEMNQLIISYSSTEKLPSSNILRILISGDSGQTWKGQSGLVDITKTEGIKTGGFTVTQLGALTKDALNAISADGKIRFAFYMDQADSTDTLEVSAINVTEVKYKTTPILATLSAIGDLKSSVRPEFFVSRNDGVDWLPIKEEEVFKFDKTPTGKSIRIKVILSGGMELHALSYSWL